MPSYTVLALVHAFDRRLLNNVLERPRALSQFEIDCRPGPGAALVRAFDSRLLNSDLERALA
jgi:hypothetical protein